MKLQLIREGNKGPLVLAWEEFLRDEQHYLVEADGFFDQNTDEATRSFQKAHGLFPDGVVGFETWGAAIGLGFDALEDPDYAAVGKESLGWPAPPSFGALSYGDRERTFGHIEFQPAPTINNPEAILITNDFAKYVVEVEVPQLRKVVGIMQGGNRVVGNGPRSGKVQVHEKVAQQLIDLWARWEDDGLLSRVLTWAGLWNPRFIRGSRTVLSNHAYATAFDINAPWNGLRKVPALLGQRGCVRELVQHANEFGWYWGGHFSRKDGMHFECIRG